jgi:hypothetical protein
MMPFLLNILGVGRVVVQCLVQWLSKRSLAEIGCIVLCIVCAILIVANRAEKRHSAKLQAQVVSLSAELQKISVRKNEQKSITDEHIKVVVKRIADADQRAKKVEQAPPAPNCQTKPEVMGADL